MRRLTHWLVVIAAAGWVTGCGARSGDELPFGFGGSGVGATGGGGTGGFGGAPYGGYGGMPYGGYGGSPYGGYGGMPMGGYGGYPGGYGGMPMGGYGGMPFGGYGGMPIGGYGGMPFGGYGGMPMGGYGGMPFGGYGGMPMGGFGGVGGGPSVSCCIPHQFPGCTPPQWAACVCQTDSYCCTTAWDNLCVSEIDSLGCGYCGGGTGGMGGVGGFGGMGGTGGGVFCPNGQYCSNLQVPGAPFVLPGCCPPTAPNACGLDTTQIAGLVPLPKGCTPKNQPGKPDPTCPPLAIGTGQMLPGCCKPSGMCGNDFSPIQLGCVNTSPYGGPPPTKCGGGGTGGTGGIGGTGGVGGTGGTGGTGGFTGSCCQTHSWPGCDNPKIWQCVCPKDSYCCANNWDSICVGEVTSLGCGSCGGTGGAGGTSGAGGTGGGSCDPAKCQLPPPMLGCCVTPNGPCGAITPSGCQPL